MSRTDSKEKDSEDGHKSAPLSGIAPLEINPFYRFFENQSKFVQDRITAVEKNFGQLCETVSSYTRKTARLRDKGDQISKDLISYVEGETLNPSSKKHFTDFAQHLSAIQDYRNAQVTRLEAKVQQPLSNYGLKCKHTKADLKAAFAARDKEHKLRKRLDIARTKGDTRQIAQLETELTKASVDASRTTKNLEQQTDKFELEKLQDAKKVFSDFVTVEMAFHAKALEMYSECHQQLSHISVDQDIREFRAKVRPSNSAARMTIARSDSASSLNTNNSSLDGDRQRGSQNSTPTRQLPQPTSNGRIGVGNTLADDDDDDDDEDDEDDEEDDDDSYEDDTELETERSDRIHQVQPVKPVHR